MIRAITFHILEKKFKGFPSQIVQTHKRIERNLIYPDQQKSTGPGCSKLTTSLVNEALKFQTLISQIRQYFLLKKCEKLLHLKKCEKLLQCKSFSHFFNTKYQFFFWL